jgi:hypothetical protein
VEHRPGSSNILDVLRGASFGDWVLSPGRQGGHMPVVSRLISAVITLSGLTACGSQLLAFIELM